MSSFIAELWESVFVPGPTPAILRATNASFAALQVTLFALLVSTYSIHFVILSVLSAGLWWSINWFAAELAAAKARGDLPSPDGPAAETAGAAAQTAAAPPPPKENSDEDTEVESPAKERPKRGKKASRGNAGRAVAKTAADVEAVEAKGDLKHRVASLSDSTGFTSQSSVSTEDEWEKVSENENDKTK
ncbi:Endoplasmic reticulum, protein Pkr1 [Cordyceps militaris CM01]|uniref:Endoplasmic reticulum, protein Pkr1 n=2 Tax=Cordyceps militaris TaxID=73501 RepID=G3JHR4_CORMM|nr:Endoplasmic reticulum, protein Pkr1 [Cordyceps militaris CM01]ATY59111.1 Endoplasmic Pkr1 [Cordyceps militaris]EGX91770.1 Endoplasmic reticulum, protein Pkr1 [Cordyceps militaris CM01]